MAPSRASQSPGPSQLQSPDPQMAPDGVIKLGVGEPGFEMLVIGCGGGPLETNLSSYLIKPYSASWEDGCTSLEGGSTIGAIARLVEDSPASFTGFGLKIGVDERDRVDAKGRPKKRVQIGPGREGGGRAAGRVWDMVKCFAISHAHLDHIQGLIISSGASMGPRPLYGTKRTLENLDAIFSGGPWPRLAGPESDGQTLGRAFLYRQVNTPTTAEFPLSPSLSFTAFPLSHGMDPSLFHRKPNPAPPPKTNEAAPAVNGKHLNSVCDDDTDPSTLSLSPLTNEHDHECYDSTAFFVREGLTGENKEMLFFGDVEPDSISKKPLNRNVWKAAAPKIVADKLCAIFLECSYPTSQPVEKLWGHLSPPYMAEELKVLAKLVTDERIKQGAPAQEAAQLPLAGVTVVIIHIKDDILPIPTSRPSTPSSATSTSHTAPPLTPTSRRVRATHQYPLSMSPPVPSVPLRRASGSGTPMWSSMANSSILGLQPFSTVGGSSLDAPPTQFWGRRASMPWNIHPSFGAPRGATNLGVAFNSPFGGGPLAPSAGSGSGLASGWQGPNLTLTPAGSGSRANSMSGHSPTSIKEEEMSGDEAGDGESSEEEEDDTEEETVHERIERELNELEDEMRTGVRFLRAEQGMRIAF